MEIETGERIHFFVSVFQIFLRLLAKRKQHTHTHTHTHTRTHTLVLNERGKLCI